MDGRILPSLWVLSISFLFGFPRAFSAESPEPLEAVGEFRLYQPEVLAARINDLFRGSKVAHPAQALSAWKRATRGDDRLGKPLEAVIAFFNPEMAREWRSLDGADLKFWTARVAKSAKPGELDWSLVLPNDDGTVADFMVAGRLTDGASEEDLPGRSGLAVNRAGSDGAPVFARKGKNLVIAGSRQALNQAIDDLKAIPPADSHIAPKSAAISFKVNTQLLAAALRESAWSTQVLELGRVVEGREIEGSATLEGDAARIRFHSQGGKPGPLALLQARPVDPTWLRYVPCSRVLAAAVVRFDPTPNTWNSLFSFVDQVEKADPAKAGTVPVRLRLNLVLGAARVQPEVDLWPHLEGMTFSLLKEEAPNSSMPETLLALHLDAETSALKLQEEFVPRIAESYLRKPDGSSTRTKSDPPNGTNKAGIQKLGEFNNRPLFLARQGRTVLLSWGGEAALTGLLTPFDQQEGTGQLAKLKSPTLSRLSLIWPGRLVCRFTGLDPNSSSGRALAAADPIVWTGEVNKEKSQIDDSVTWTGLHSLINALLGTIPLDVPNR